LSRAFLDANGKPFSEDLGGVEKSTEVESNGKQDHVGIVNGESLQELGERRGYDQYLGQNPKVSVTEDHQHMVPGTSMVSGKKRSRRERLSTQITISDDESEEADHDEGLAGMKKKSRKPPVTSIGNPVKRGEEPLAGPRNLGQDVMRSSSAGARHESTGTKEVPRRGPSPSRRDKCFTSDSETQVLTIVPLLLARRFLNEG